MLPNNITLSTNLKPALKDFFSQQQFSKIGVLIDENTQTHCYPLIQSLLPEHTTLQIRSGEEHKTLLTCQQIWQWMTQQHFDRQSLLINLGGGVIGDMGGFCAAAFKRGMAFINIPTTLLAQVDASIGGKLGIDFMGFKNHIGFFRIPDHVFISPDFLTSLPQRELRSGFSEVIKHTLIADREAWNELSRKKVPEIHWLEQVEHSVQLKQRIVSQDPTEKGLRKILNFGHTIGHALESYFLESNRLLHGEAIAIGMIAEAYLSHKLLGLPRQELEQISCYIRDVHGKTPLEKNCLPQIAQLCLQDKKNRENNINCVLLSQIGEARYDIPISEEEIIEALEFYNNE
jgi:3-dehydroquinate synthase